jgi:HEAT repeat protein
MTSADGQLYVSYSNKDAIFALKISSDLLCAGYNVQMDRLCYDPQVSWNQWNLDALSDCDSAIFLISSTDIDDYCQAELDILREKKVPVIPVLLGNMDATSARKLIGGKATASVDLRDWRTLDSYRKGFQQIKTVFSKLSITPAEITPEYQYLVRLVADMEQRLLQSFSSTIALRLSGQRFQDHLIRPRAYDPEAWLLNGEYLLQEQGVDQSTPASDRSGLVVENILQWLNLRPQMVLIGEAGSGKSTVFYHLVLAIARARMRDRSKPLPLFADLIEWREKKDFLNEFLAERVPFIRPVRDSLLSGQIMLFIDGLNEIHGRQEHRLNWIQDWLNKETVAAIVVACRSENYYKDITLPLPVMHMKAMTPDQVQTFLAATLPAQQAAGLAEALLQTSIPRIPSYIVLAALQQATFPNRLIEFTQGYLLAQALPALWESADKQMLGRFSLQQIAEALQQFAWSLVDQGAQVYVPRQVALEAMQDDLLIQTAIYLNLLTGRDGKIRFQQHALQTYFTAEAVLREGIYTHLTYPTFSEDGHRKSTIWDAVICLIPELLAHGARIRTIETIAEVDPYLAFECVIRQPDMPDWLTEEVLWKLLDMRRHTYRSMRATASVFEKLEQYELSAAVLIKALHSDDWSTSQTAFSFLLKLPLTIPANLIDTLSTLDRNFPDTFFEAAENFQARTLLPALMKLTTHHRTQVRRNAIWALGEHADQAAVPALTSISLDETPEILQETAQALGKLGDQRAKPYLLQLVANSNRDVIGKALDAIQRLGHNLAAHLLRIIADIPDGLSRTIIQEVAHADEKTIALALCSQFEPHSTLRPLVEEALRDGEVAEKVRRLLDYISDKMQSLRDRNAFDDLTSEIESALGAQPSPEERAAHLNALAARVRGAAVTIDAEPAAINAQTVRTGQQVIPDHLPTKLKQALEHPEWLIRQRAVRQLKLFPERLALPCLLDALKDSDVQVRVAAIEALPEPDRYPVVIEALLKALDDTEYHVIDAATDKLKEHGTRFVPRLIEKLSAQQVITLAAVIELLGELADTSAVEHIIPFLADNRSPWMGGKTIGESAAQALLAIGSVEGMQAVQEAGYLQYRAPTDILHPGIDASSGDDYIAELMEKLRGDSWDVSQKAAKDLRDYARKLEGSTRASRQMAAALNDENWVVRWTAAESLAWIKDPLIVPQLANLLQDPNWIVQIAAIRALVEINARDSVATIMDLLKAENSGVREAAAEAIGLLGTSDDLPALINGFEDDDKFVRLAVVKAIAEIPGDESIRILVQALQDEYSHVRWHAIRKLADMEDPRLVRYFIKRLNDNHGPTWEDKKISEIALEGIQRIKSPESERVLEKIKEIQLDKSRK